MFSRRVQAATTRGVSYGASSLQGRRPSQEDRYTAVEQLAPGCGIYAVYDGHGGDRAAIFATEVMAQRVLKSEGFQGKRHGAALEWSFGQVEKEFLAMAEREGLSDGTTAVVALVREDYLAIAHVGDSRGVLCRAGSALALTEDHKPEIASERRRIESLGGFVSYIGCWRAMGILAMSRAIGDLFLKPYVSAIPDVRELPLGPSDEFLVLASDGVFDVFDNDQVVRIVRAADDPQHAASLLTKSALAAGSLDNITAVVVALRGYKPRQMDSPSPAEPAWAGGLAGRAPNWPGSAAAAAANPAARSARAGAPACAAGCTAARAIAYSVAEAAPAPVGALRCWGTSARDTPPWASPWVAAAVERLALPFRRAPAVTAVAPGAGRAAGLPRGVAAEGRAGRSASWEVRFDSWHRVFAAVEGC